MTWREAYAQALRILQELGVEYADAAAAAKRILRLGEQVAPWREQRNYDRGDRY